MNKSQFQFTLALHATWAILRDPILTKIYVKKWKRQSTTSLIEDSITLYGFIFRLMYKEVIKR